MRGKKRSKVVRCTAFLCYRNLYCRFKAEKHAARAADATGGTVLHARSYHDESRAHLLGFKVQKEKDVVIILSRRDSARQIMKAINEACGFDSEANGIVFSLPVDHFMGM